ncbi:MAG: Glycosyl transferase family 2 [Candidatus Magnetoglobus multicellularis str. Araruama]|uniref:Glycosyl transferase family 2 n=1 Tax=Candidatus Magnetoglobus multicellularis str. Araruama TaxID=890399 RepID=A0A1V1NZ55_9BACT|nr:MAG: Glycosyl transferase family 2 [Candidatus Magnetoglobus multicellularis str. Araruama]
MLDDQHLIEKQYYLHETLNIEKTKKIVLFIGSIANWTMADYILESTRFWPDDWVLVINNRYANKTNPYYEHSFNRDKVFFCAHPSEKVHQLENILLSADMGIALYRPLQRSIGCGNNIRYIGMSSGKIGTYLKYGLPVITNEIGEMSTYIKKYDLGTVIDVRKAFVPSYSGDNIASWKKNCIQFFNHQLDLNISIKPFIQKLKNITSNHDKKNEINTILYQAKQALQQGNMAKSIQLLLMIVDKNPDHPMALHYLGVIHLKIGEREQDLRYMNKAYINS